MYAWFTMSREVEVSGINLTATVPEGLQISPGHITSSFLEGNYKNSSGTQVSTAGNSLYQIKSPESVQASKDWSNSIVFSDYYEFGRLTPSTSVKGVDMWYTKDATGTGKTLKGQVLETGSDTTNGSGTISASFTNADGDNNYTAAALIKSTGGTNTLTSGTDAYYNGGAYYVDIPVWFRSSADEKVNLAVQVTASKSADSRAGYTPNDVGSRASGATYAEDDLVNAVRVSVLKINGNFSATTLTDVNGVTNTDAAQKVFFGTSGASYYAQEANQRPVSGQYTVNATTAGAANNWAVVQSGTQATQTEIDDGNAATGKTPVVTVPAGSKNNYGTPVGYVIRVWIDGEDQDCWNATAGQDFTVGLKFVQINSALDSVRG